MTQADGKKVFKMRDTTSEEQKSVDDYIKSISKPTGINLWDLADGEYISRQAVMDCYKKWQPYMATRLHEFEKELSELPSVAIPSAYKGMTNGEVITKILKDAEWAELSSDFGLAQEDTIYIKVGGYWWNSPYEPQESEDKE